MAQAMSASKGERSRATVGGGLGNVNFRQITARYSSRAVLYEDGLAKADLFRL